VSLFCRKLGDVPDIGDISGGTHGSSINTPSAI
jgi:hypothetical protein